MKLSLAFILFFTLNLSANGFGQQRVDIKAKKTEMAEVLSSIEKQTGYRFLYNSDLKEIRNVVTINAKRATVAEVLPLLFQGTTLTYQEMANNLIVIKTDPAIVKDVVVTGQVLDDQGAPLPGVSVLVKGTAIGTTTDADGNFTISVPNANSVLVFSSVGFNEQEYPLNGQTSVILAMVASQKMMDQVVVIGYGTASKRDLTGSITRVGGEQVADKPNPNPVASLQGKVPGLSIVNSGRLGQEPDVRIRGTVSLTQTKPLYIIDGIFNDNMNFVNPADIESMEILKDPSSLAIFGVRGANGVIIVTTKKGKAGRISVNFNSSIGVKKVVDIPELTDAAGFRTLYDEQRANDGIAPYQYYNLYNGNSDWIRLLLKDNPIVNNNNISLQSGTEKNKFYMGVGYLTEEGVFKYEKYNKLTLTVSDELTATKNFKIGFNVNGYRAMLPQSYNFGNALIATPIIDAYNDAADVYNKLPGDIGGPQIGNPLMMLEATKNTHINREYRVVGSAFAEWNFLRDLTFRANLLGDLGFNDGRSYTPIINVFDAEANAVTPQGGYTRTGVNQYKNSFQKFQQDYLLTYKKIFGDHKLTALGGFTTYFNDYSSMSGSVLQSATGDPIPNDKRWWYLGVYPYGDVTTRLGNSDQWERANMSWLFRALYNFKGKYLLNASFRRDGSSDISSYNRWDNFWSLGAAWNIKREDFMSDNNFFNDLKLKASIGKLGNQYTRDAYPFYPFYRTGESAVFGNNIIPAYVLRYLADSTLKWETVGSYEAGIEFLALDRRLSFEGNYFSKTTNDLLTFVSEGANNFYWNAGSVRSSGIELSANWAEKLASGINYSLGGNLTTFNSKVISVFKPGYTILDGPSRTVEGLPIAHFYGYVHDGLYQSYADKLASPDAGSLGAYGPGDIRFKDVDNNGIINDRDRTMIGNPTPDFTYGINGSVGYNGLDLAVDFQGVYGNEIYRAWGADNGFAQFNYRAARLERWTEAGSSNWEPRATQGGFNTQNSTYMIEDGSYFRLRNIQLGYTFGSQMLSRTGIKSLRVFLNGQNLKTWKHNSGFTPEAGGSATSFGVDNGGYPIPAITTLGINLNF